LPIERPRFDLKGVLTREFLGLVLPDAPPNHSTISRTRRVIDLTTHGAVFTWMLRRLADTGLVNGKTVGIDATTLDMPRCAAGQRVRHPQSFRRRT
jgi:hypothetical protein